MVNMHKQTPTPTTAHPKLLEFTKTESLQQYFFVCPGHEFLLTHNMQQTHTAVDPQAPTSDHRTPYLHY